MDEPSEYAGAAFRKYDYKAAGVDLDAYERTMDLLPSLLRRTFTRQVIDWPGGFAGLCRMDGDWMHRLAGLDPVLVVSADGVGSKLKLAFATNRHGTIGIDLVAMSVNDCLCAGAEPLVFLDYVAMPRDDPELTARVVKGVSDGCIEAGCALVGGETATLPGRYRLGEYGLVGFCVGVVRRSRLLDGRAIREGDSIVGLASTGLHANGYNLARKLALDVAGLRVDSYVPELGHSVADEFLVPTRIYSRAIRAVRRTVRSERSIHGIAHITGGGLVGNLPRILPPGLRARLRRGSWTVPAVFGWLQGIGDVQEAEMDRVFNMGIGMVLVVAPGSVAAAIRGLALGAGVAAWEIGEVILGDPGVEWTGTA